MFTNWLNKDDELDNWVNNTDKIALIWNDKVQLYNNTPEGKAQAESDRNALAMAPVDHTYLVIKPANMDGCPCKWRDRGGHSFHNYVSQAKPVNLLEYAKGK